MVKLTKYLKPFALSIAAVIVLLFAQAQCELALPDYMADIVCLLYTSPSPRDTR